MAAILGDFIQALRANDVRVSTSEALEAAKALALIGYERRALLRDGLAQTLAKSLDEKQAFFETFDAFFAFEPVGSPAVLRPATEPTTPAGDTTLPQAWPAPNARATPSAGGTQGGGGESQGASGESQGAAGGTQGAAGGTQAAASRMQGDGRNGDPSLLDILNQADTAALQARLADAARAVDLNAIRYVTQRGIYTVRILDQMGMEAVDRAIAAAETSDAASDRARGRALRTARATVVAAVRAHIDTRLTLFAANAGRRLRDDILATTRLSAIERSDFKRMQELVRKMAKRLIAVHSRRKRVAQRGHLDVRRTLRANIEYDGLLFQTVWKRRRRDRPKVMALCDVSGSVAQTARFLLLFLSSLHDVLPDVRSFAFSSALGEVTDLFEHDDVDRAMTETLARFGGSTDYGQALETFVRLAGADVDHRTTVLILGDARNNNGPPRADLLRKIQDRARRVIFLNPEPRSSWNTGDSVMRAYAACSDAALVCATPNDLERVVSDLLRTAV